MGFLILVVIVVAGILYVRLTSRLDSVERDGKGLDALRDRVDRLERHLSALRRQLGRGAPELEQQPADATDASEDIATAAVEEPSETGEPLGVPLGAAGHLIESGLVQPPVRSRPATTRPPAEPPPESELRKRWRRIEQRLIENWTGVLGSVVLVAGITFIGAYAGLRLAPVYRCAMLVAAAAVLAGGSFFLRRRGTWVPLAHWLGSAAAAVFLFAMFASSAIPGLRWISGFVPALGALLLGVAANLYVAGAAKGQGFASLHVVLSLVPLVLVPQSDIALMLATLVTGAGLALALRPGWDLHALITLAAYVVYHVAWHVRALEQLPNERLRLIGVGSTVLVAAVGVLGHYRKTVTTPSLATIPFLVHMGSWGIAALGLIVHLSSSPWRAATLLAAAFVVFFLGRRGRLLGLRWVHLTDTLTAQALAMAGVLFVYPFVFHWLFLYVVLFVETAIFVRVVIDEQEQLLARVGVRLLHLSGLVLAIVGWAAIAGASEATRTRNAALLLGAAAVAAAAHLYMLRKRDETFDSFMLYGGGGPDNSPFDNISLLGCGAGILTVAALANLFGGSWMEAAALGAVGGFVLLARRAGSQGLGAAVWLTLVAACLLSWYQLLAAHPMPVSRQLLRPLGPLTLATGLAIAYPPSGSIERFLRSSAIYLLGAQFAVAAYTLLQPVSPLIPGIVWLSLSLVALEVANRLPLSTVRPVLHLGYAYFALFAAAYVLVVLQAQAYFGPVRVRMLIELYALGVLAFWWRYRPRATLAEQRSWLAVHPIVLELLLTSVVIATVVEIAPSWRPLVWGAVALGCITPFLGVRLDARLRFYSLAFFWASAIDLVLVTSTFAIPAPRWYQHPGFTGALAIALQVAYLVYGSGRLALADIQFPRPLGRLAMWSGRIAARQALWVYYPFFVGGALFLYWRFDAAVLTLLWAAEAFLVFVLSVVLRENQFRYMALAGLAACLVRLLMFDMAQANLAMRGVVFIGVGGLMLGMNSLYNKYKERFA